MPQNKSAAERGEDRPKRRLLGTFGGVFTPSILTILGIILFLRLGFVVGSAGLTRALIIIALANGVSILTSLSLAATATNIRVKVGGVYYLISRTLGVEFGGALGIVLFLAQSISIAFYAIGFAEAVTAFTPGGPAWLPQAIAAASIVVLFVFAWLGADAATKLQYGIMATLIAALVAFFTGVADQFDPQVLQGAWAPGGSLPFWTLFAIFFPAVTGFTQGVAMSGDLKDPARSITRGTFGAVLLSAVIYFAVAVLLAGAVPTADLVGDYRIMARVSPVSWLIDVGVIAATLSSALASLLGAPRILQSMAADKVFPLLNRFAVGVGPSNNPRRGVLLSGLIALATVSLGDLNVVAPVVSMFFLISYGLLNYATYLEARSNSPSFRPSFRFYHGRLSLLGGLACVGAMLAINALAAALALLVIFAIYQYLWRRGDSSRWADSSRNHRFQIVRQQLHVVHADHDHPLHWRPVILALSPEPVRRARTLQFAEWIEGGSGFTTALGLIEGEGLAGVRRRDEAESELVAELARNQSEAFARVVVSPDPELGLQAALQAHGLGPVRPNTLLLDYSSERDTDGAPALGHHHGRMLRAAVRLGCNVILFESTAADLERVSGLKPRKRRIDVWFSDDPSGRLILLLCHLMTRKKYWQGARLRLLLPAQEGVDSDELRASLGDTLRNARIEAEVVVVESTGRDQVLARSRDASAVFLPFRLIDQVPTCPFANSLDELVAGLPACALVMASQDIRLDAEPESGRAAEIAEAVDIAAQADVRATRLEKDAERLKRQVEELRERLEATRPAEGEPDEEFSAKLAELTTAEEEAEEVRRRALKARAKATQADRDATAMREDTSRQAPSPAPPSPAATSETPQGSVASGGATGD